MARYDFLIINRSFWPIYPVIGEGLLRLAEELACTKKVGVILQDHVGIKKKLKSENRGLGVIFFPGWAISNSSSNILIRVLDSIFFMFWVIGCLLLTRPRNIYVSTDPPVIIPFVIAIYSKVFKTKFIYHVQDIHPEASNAVMKLNSLIFYLLKIIDNFTLWHANLLVTLTSEMRVEIINRSNTKKNILIIDNPSISFKRSLPSTEKIRGFSFTGNLGRLQRIPLILEAIEDYRKKGGRLNFLFAGGGIYSNLVSKFSKLNSLISYKGFISPENSALLSSKYEWALLPIDDKITNYAFPSKTSSYVFSGAKILAICGEHTSVAQWVKFNNLGIVISPKVSKIVEFFFKLENGQVDSTMFDVDRKKLKKRLHIDVFVQNLKSVFLSNL